MSKSILQIKILIAFIPMLLSVTCYTFKDASFPPDLKTFEVAYFPNQAELVNPALSQQFTEALKDKILRESNLNLVSENGHVAFSGAITEYSVTPVAATSGETVSLNRLKIVVKVDFKNNQEEKGSWTSAFSRFVDYSSSLNFSTNENSFVEEIIAQVVDDVFKKAFVNW